MEKSELLTAVRDMASRGMLTEEEVQAAFATGRTGASQDISAPQDPDASMKKKIGIAEVFGYIGGLIVVVGISLLIQQNWALLGSFMRIAVTLGVGVVAYVIGVLFSRFERLATVSHIAHLIAAVVLPLGLAITFYESGAQMRTGTFTTIAGILFALYFASFLVFRTSMFLVFSIIFGTGLFYNGTNLIADNRSFSNFSYYRNMTVGLTYLFLGYGLAEGMRQRLSGWLYGLGTLFFLSGVFFIGVTGNSFGAASSFGVWELVFPILIALFVAGSVWLKSKSMLFFSALHLVGYIMYLSFEYFASVIGWPIALVIAGFALIGVAGSSVYLNKKFIKKPASPQTTA